MIAAWYSTIAATSVVAALLGPGATDPGTHLFLTKTQNIGQHGTATLKADLLCDPPGGGHPKAADACAALAAAGGDFTKLKPAGRVNCPTLVRPVTVSAQGRYRGTPVDYTQTFNNYCEADRATHPLFDF